MINVLFIFEGNNRRALDYTIQTLRNNNCSVTELCFDQYWNCNEGYTPTKESSSLADSYNNVFDFIIMATHCMNLVMADFQERCKAKYGYYNIEHDLYNSIIERCNDCHLLGVFSFTKFMTNYLKSRNIKYFEASWYKLDTSEITSRPDYLNNAILIDTSYTNKDIPFEYKHLFTKVYLKNFYPTERNSAFEKNLETNLVKWYDTQGLVDMLDLAKFWFSFKSSAIIEALLMNRIPILWRAEYTDEIQINDIISEIRIIDTSPDKLHQFDNKLKMITATNIDYKIKELQNNPLKLEETQSILKQDWCFDEPKPKVVDILLEDMARIINDHTKS